MLPKIIKTQAVLMKTVTVSSTSGLKHRPLSVPNSNSFSFVFRRGSRRWANGRLLVMTKSLVAFFLSQCRQHGSAIYWGALAIGRAVVGFFGKSASLYEPVITSFCLLGVGIRCAVIFTASVTP